VSRVLVQLMVGATLLLTIVSGCDSCQESPELPAVLPKEGRLPPAPQPIATQGTVVIPPPSCAVVASPSEDEGDAPLEVHFTGEGMCTDADGKFTWDFGDGSPPTHEQNPTHVYTQAGTYTATVTLEDPEHDAKDSDEAPITVNAK